MGASQSLQALSSVASHEQLLERLGGPAAIEYGDAFWGQLFAATLPLASEDPAAVQEALVPHCRQLMVHNPLTHNFQRLVLHTLDLVAAAHSGRPSLAVANALHLCGLVLKFIIETGSPSSLSVSFEVTPGLPPSVQGAWGQQGGPCVVHELQLPAARCPTKLLSGSWWLAGWLLLLLLCAQASSRCCRC
jgi:hypothetical protein